MIVSYAILDCPYSTLVRMRGSSGLKGDEMLSGMMVVTGSAHSEGMMAEQKPEENQVHWEEVHPGDEQLVYDCCDPHD